MNKLLYLILIVLCIYSFTSFKAILDDKEGWYRNEVRFSNWRDVGHVQFSTNAVVTNWYSNIDSLDLKVINRNPWFDIKGTNEANYSRYFRKPYFYKFDSLLLAGDSVTLGIDYYALFALSAQHLNLDYLAVVKDRLLSGEVIRLKFWVDSTKIFAKEF